MSNKTDGLVRRMGTQKSYSMSKTGSQIKSVKVLGRPQLVTKASKVEDNLTGHYRITAMKVVRPVLSRPPNQQEIADHEHHKLMQRATTSKEEQKKRNEVLDKGRKLR